MSKPNAGHANLRPAVQPGDPPRNPLGHNQYTARSEAAKAWDALALEVKGDKRRLDDFLNKVWEEAQAGEPWAAKALLDRLVPVVTGIEHLFPDGAPAVKVPATDERLRAVAEIVQETMH